MQEPKFNYSIFRAIKDAPEFGSQRAFARGVGVTESFLSEVINGKRILDGFRQNLWAALLDTTAQELFGNDMSPTSQS